MKYKTIRAEDKEFTRWFLYGGIFVFIVALVMFASGDAYYSGNVSIAIGMIIMFLLSLIMYIYSWSEDFIRAQYYKKGIKLPATIICAEKEFNSRGSNKYYLIIEFFDCEQKLLKKTSAYAGNPNMYLSSRQCSIYKYKGKYLEGDFILKEYIDYNNGADIDIMAKYY